jgi:hypothetical protein
MQPFWWTARRLKNQIIGSMDNRMLWTGGGRLMQEVTRPVRRP